MLRVSLSRAEQPTHDDLCFNFANDDGLSKRAAFSVPKDFYASGDVLAAVAIAIRPVACDRIDFSFPISRRAKEIALKSYGINLSAPVDLVCHTQPRSKTFLNFSGGVDSLAAHFLIGESAEKISIDFGGAFAREAEWFREWNTIVVETDFRLKPFTESLDWRFMAAPAILFSDYLDIDTLCWGTVLEASPYWLSSNVKTESEKSKPTHIFEIADLKVTQTVSALSEYGTMKVAASLGETVLDRSIASCAPLRSEKFLRKQLLKRIVLQRNIDHSFFEEHKLPRKHQFGSSFGADVLTLYFVWRLGLEIVQKYLADFSIENVKKIGCIDMGFFEKINTANIPSIASHLREKITAGYHQCGLSPYNEADFQALSICREFLGDIHGYK